MTDIITQQSLVPSQAVRQDVVSALLDDYSNSFEAYEYPLIPASKGLPPIPPPRVDSLKDRPLPAVGSPAHRMSMQFPLRDDQYAPVSPDGSPVSQRSNRIVHRSLSRDGKPPSLKLVVSNGATAIIPPSQVFPVPTKTLSSSPPQNKRLPPPRVQSNQENSAESSMMGTAQSGQMSELERNDSFHSQRGARPTVTESSMTADRVPAVRRKPLGSNVMKFVGLVEGEDAPRGRQGAPTSVPMVVTAKSNTTTHTQIPQLKKGPTNGREGSVQVVSRMPPTPPEENKTVPSPPRKALVNIGLPSNPRPRGPASPLHQRGKSSTGFNILKAHRPAPPIPTRGVKTITPAMTPSPTLKPEQQKDQEISPVSPLPQPSDQNHHELSPAPQATAQELQEQLAHLRTPAIAPPAPTPPAPLFLTTTVNPPEPSPSVWPSTAPSYTFSFFTHPASTILSRASPPISPTSTPTLAPPQPTSTTPISPLPPFTPLTRLSIPLSTTLIPAITPEQLSCYTSHYHNIWSNNWFQPMGCMVCQSNSRDRKWCCTWCQLRMCRECSEELAMVPGREVGVLLEAKKSIAGQQEGGKGMPGIVVSAVEGEEKEKEREHGAEENGDAAAAASGNEEDTGPRDEERRGRSPERVTSPPPSSYSSFS